MANNDDGLKGLVDHEEIPEATRFPDEDTIEDSGNEAIVSEQSHHVTNRDTALQQDMIVAVFVVTFDTRKGNIIEWKHPETVQLTGVEFKALPSGSHKVFKDFVYFKHDDSQFGLSCFQRITVENEDERGVRMKSVGIVCSKYTSLHEHMEFLEQQVRIQLEHPGSYNSLLSYYNQFRVCEFKNNWLHSPQNILGVEDLPVLKITHPAGCFSQFLNFFSEKIFIIWKLILLHRRILFFSPPPVGISCYRVYCACLMGCHSIPLFYENGANPLFFTNIFDIPMLALEHKYIACTTEKIFETKSDLFDVYVDNQNIKCQPYLSPLQHVNSYDRDRYSRLLEYRSNQLFNGGEVVDDEKMYARFFADLNNHLFESLIEVSSTRDKVINAETMRKMGFDPKNDRTFFLQLIELYGIDIHFQQDSCCPM